MFSQTFLESRFSVVDWDFVSRRTDRSPFSRFHWYPGQLISQIPATLIGLLSEPGDLVVDPFAGSGSVVTEAQRLGRKALAIDVNPVATMIVRAKTIGLASHAILSIITSISRDIGSLQADELPLYRTSVSANSFPSGVQVDKWYSPRVACSLNRLWCYCQSQSGEKRLICDAMFSACLRAACRETRSWGYICDNVMPKPEANNDSFDVFRAVRGALKLLCDGYEVRHQSLLRLRSDSPNGEVPPRVSVLEAPAQRGLATIAEGGAKLFVTSPPYFGVHDYAKSQRLSMEWFGYAIENARIVESGARSKRARLRAREEYLFDLESVFKQAHRALVPGGWLCVVVGESKSRSSVLDELKERVTGLGFALCYRSGREVGKDRSMAPKLMNEDVMVWQK